MTPVDAKSTKFYYEKSSIHKNESLIEDTRQKLEAHNKALSAADQTDTLVSQAERSLADLSERMLTGVASKYGKRSDEYEMAGGVRKRTGKRNSRKVSASTPTESPDKV